MCDKDPSNSYSICPSGFLCTEVEGGIWSSFHLLKRMKSRLGSWKRKKVHFDSFQTTIPLLSLSQPIHPVHERRKDRTNTLKRERKYSDNAGRTEWERHNQRVKVLLWRWESERRKEGKELVLASLTQTHEYTEREDTREYNKREMIVRNNTERGTRSKNNFSESFLPFLCPHPFLSILLRSGVEL